MIKSSVICPDGSSFQIDHERWSSFTDFVDQFIHLFLFSGWFQIIWNGEEVFDTFIQDGVFLAWKNLNIGKNYWPTSELDSQEMWRENLISREDVERMVNLRAFQ